MAWTQFSACTAHLQQYTLVAILASLACPALAAQERHDCVLAPNHLALPPDSIARQFYLTASEPDTELITLTASTLNPVFIQ